MKTSIQTVISPRADRCWQTVEKRKKRRLTLPGLPLRRHIQVKVKTARTDHQGRPLEMSKRKATATVVDAPRKRQALSPAFSEDEELAASQPSLDRPTDSEEEEEVGEVEEDEEEPPSFAQYLGESDMEEEVEEEEVDNLVRRAAVLLSSAAVINAPHRLLYGIARALWHL